VSVSAGPVVDALALFPEETEDFDIAASGGERDQDAAVCLGGVLGFARIDEPRRNDDLVGS
jgi:hypothetical protein